MGQGSSTNSAPLSAAQIWALLGAAGRELSWGLREVTRQSSGWKAAAERIPDQPTREDALFALARKRGHADGAALFSVLPRHRDPALIQALISFETILDFLDEVSERHPTEENGRQLHLALLEAVSPDLPTSDYYRHHPWRDDGGYLEALVERCREGCRALPSLHRVQTEVARAAELGQVLGLNHLPDPAERDAALRRWAAHEFPGERELEWFELSGAASATLAVHALLALAAEPSGVSDREIAATQAAYGRWVSAATAMLDSYADRLEDAANEDHSYIAHYPDFEQAVERTSHLIERALAAASALERGRRHAVIAACMVAMYLSKDSSRSTAMRPTTRRLSRSGGSLVRALLPVLRAWRIFYSQRSA